MPQTKEERQAYTKAYYRKNREKMLASQKRYADANPDKARHKRLKARYGISLKEYERMCASQEGRCLICDSQPKGRLAVDHSHETGEVRGLLCKPCNAAIGLLSENTENLSRAIVYLERFNT